MIMAYQVKNTAAGKKVDNSESGNGPRLEFSKDEENYMIIGAYDKINNIDSGNRPLTIVVKGGLTIQGLKPAPPKLNTVNLVIDKDTGKIYSQS